MRKIFSVLLVAGIFCVSGFNPIYAQSTDFLADARITNTKTDSLLSKSFSNSIWLSYQDSVNEIPSYEVYCKWDTTIIHPYNFPASVFNDTTTLVLAGENLGNFSIPCKGKTNSNFGPRHRQAHFGIDLHLQTGDSVYAAFDGMVRIAKLNKSYGNVVIIRHQNGLETIYAHLSKILVSPNQKIKSNDIIGLGGNTGHSFGSHLHFEVRYKGEPIDPNDLISFENQKLIADTITITSKNFEIYNFFLNGGYKTHRISNKKHLKYIVKNTKSTKKSSFSVSNSYCIVKKGDTLYSIAKKYHTTPEHILKINKMKSTAVLKVGEKIKFS